MKQLTKCLGVLVLTIGGTACTPHPKQPAAPASMQSTGEAMGECKKKFEPDNVISVVITNLQLDNVQADITQQPRNAQYPYGDPNMKTAAPPPEDPQTPLDFGTALSGNAAKKREHILIVVSLGAQVDSKIKFHGDGLAINALEKNGKRMFCLRNAVDFPDDLGDRRTAFIAKYDNLNDNSGGKKYTHGSFNINLVVPQQAGLSLPISLDPEVTNDGVIQ